MILLTFKPTNMDIFNTLADAFRPMPVESIAEKVNTANNALFGATGTTRLTETWTQWGLHPDSTPQEIDLMVRDFEEYMIDKAKGAL